MDFSMSENGRALSLLLSFSPSLHMTMRSLGWWRWQPIVQSAFSEPLARLLLRDETSEYEGGRKNGRGREKEKEREREPEPELVVKRPGAGSFPSLLVSCFSLCRDSLASLFLSFSRPRAYGRKIARRRKRRKHACRSTRPRPENGDASACFYSLLLPHF